MLALSGATEWLADADGVYEEARLDALITDLTPALSVAATRTTDDPGRVPGAPCSNGLI
ncbi:hypothetical protein [Micromonospora avicenniae]|uniref:hypothetical protein n=1 Tax=Micromonospora avicenniae TaxID=1198245 RepID=UPI0033234522